MKCITSLPIIIGTHPNRVYEFYEKFIVATQALDNMDNVKDINGYVKITLDKLPGIPADLLRLDDDWQDCGFTQLKLFEKGQNVTERYLFLLIKT